MKKLHIANTNFEFELTEKAVPVLKQAISKHPVTLQLQFLPLLFVDPEDEILVTDLPDNDYLESLQKIRGELPKFVLEAQNREVHSWGWSRSIQEWARKRNCMYEMPPWDVIGEVNSKEWSFQNSPKLESSSLIYSIDELEKWIKQNPILAVAKTCFGLSGRGHCLFQELTPKLKVFCAKEWKQKRPLIVEPWLERVLDFSTQWFIDAKQIHFLGATKMFNNAFGSYEGTMTGGVPEHILQEHSEYALSLLEMARKKGYRGYVGVDGMVHKNGLHPIVEINARMTMALVALLFQNKMFPKDILLFKYVNSKEGLLPQFLQTSNKMISFTKQLQFQKVAIDL